MTEAKAEAPVATPAIPVEEVKAASQPTKVPERVERPDRQVLDKELKVIDAEIEKCKAVLDDVKAKMDILHGDSEANSGKDTIRTKLNELRAATKVFAEQRKGLFQDLDKNKALTKALRDKSDELQQTLKDTANIKDFSTAAVEKKVNDLDYYMSTTPLSLKEEKDVIAQIKALNASKKMISGFDDLSAKKDAAAAERKALSSKLDDNKKAFTAAKELEDAQWEIVKKASGKDDDKKSQRKTLLEARENARTEMNAHYTKIRALREDHKNKENAWRKYMDLKRKADQEKWAKEQEERKEEMKLQKLEEEAEKEASKDANKLASIDQLLNYLAKFSTAAKEEEATAEVWKGEMDGLQAIGKKARGFEDDIFGTKSSKKGKKNKKGGKNKGGKGMSHDVKCLQEFETLKIEPPLSQADVPTAVAALQEKKGAMKKESDARDAKRKEKMAVVQAAIDVKEAAKAEEKAAAKAARAAAAAAAKEEEAPADEEAPAADQ